MPKGSRGGQAVRALDEIFLDVFKAMNDEIIAISGAAAEQVLKLSGSFLDERARKAVGQFHALYFGTAAVEKSKADVNVDVDRLIADIQSEVAKGSSDEQIDKAVTENKAFKATRLQLSAIQKELETIIRLDQGVKEKLMPVLTCMQFEDMVRQRLEHILLAWDSIVHGIGADGILDPELLGVEIEANLTSVAERAQFYRTVLKKEPPANDVDSGGILFDL